MFMNYYTVTTLFPDRAHVCHVSTMHPMKTWEDTAKANGAIYVIVQVRDVRTAVRS